MKFKTLENYCVYGIHMITLHCGVKFLCTYWSCLTLSTHSIESDFVTWEEKLWPTVCSYFGLDMNATGRCVFVCVYVFVCVRVYVCMHMYVCACVYA